MLDVDVDLLVCRYALNRNVEGENNRHLSQLTGKEHLFTAFDQGKEPFVTRLQKDCQAPTEVRLKVDAQVVLLKNLSFDDGLVNGSRGVVVDFSLSEQEEAEEGVLYPVVKFVLRTSQTVCLPTGGTRST